MPKKPKKETTKTIEHKIEPPIVPPRPDRFHRLALYSMIWRDQAGDKIRGDLLGAQPIEMLDGAELVGAVVNVHEPTPVVAWDERGVRQETVAKGTIVTVAIRGAALGRLVDLLQRTDEKLAQVIELHNVLVAWDVGGELRQRSMHLCYIADEPSQRSNVDPAYQKAVADARRREQQPTTQ